MATQELTFKINVDPAVAATEFRRFTTQVVAGTNEVTNVTRQQQQAVISLQRQRSAALIAEFKKEEREAQRTEAAKLRETLKTANQRLREEQRAAREVARINAETARQAAAQERIREQAAKRLADVQIREAKRAAKELESSLRSQSGAGGGGFAGSAALLGAASRIPGLGGLTSELSSLTAATQAAGAAQSSLAGPIGLVTVAVAAQITGVIALHREFFQLARQAAEFQGNLFDMSQQVGVSVETLSTLEVLASTTGGNIETVAASMAIFQKNLEAAHDPTSKEAKLLAQLGVTSSDTEEALAQALAGLFKLGEGSRQTAATLELFGRSGRFINAILKESEGDLERAKVKFAELGIVVGTDAARAADQFNDNLALLHFQIRGLTALVANEAIPTITGALEGTRKTLKDNQDAVEALGFAVKTTTAILSVPFFSALSTIDALVKTHKGEILLLKAAYESLAAAMQLVTNNVPDISPNLIPPQSLEKTKSGIELLLELQRRFKAGGGLGFDGKGLTDTRKLEPLFKKDKDQAGADPAVAAKRLAEVTLANTVAGLNAEEAAFKRSLNRREIEFELYVLEIKRLEFDRSRNIVAGLMVEEAAAKRLRDEGQKAIALKEIEGRQQQEKIRHKNVLNELDDRRFAINEQINTAISQQEKAIASLTAKTGTFNQAVNDLIDSLEKQGVTLSKTQEFWLRFNAQIGDSIERMRILIPLLRESAELVPKPNEGQRLPEVDPKRLIDPATLGVPPPESLQNQIDAAIEAQGAFAGLAVAISDAMGTGGQAAIAIADSMSVAFSGVAQAVGDAVHAFILFGTAQGGFRKFAAEVIASIARMAVVNAVWETAQGLAMLALTWFTGNPKYAQSAGAHFAAAAAYGLVAGVAVPLGRAVAGDTFKQQPGGGGGAGDGGSSGPQQLNPLTVNRNQPQPPRTIVLQIQSNDSHIVKVVGADIRSAGQLRELILNDGGV